MSKNKIKIIFDEEFVELIVDTQLVELDLSSNVENDINDSEYLRFKESIKKFTNKKIHI